MCVPTVVIPVCVPTVVVLVSVPIVVFAQFVSVDDYDQDNGDDAEQGKQDADDGAGPAAASLVAGAVVVSGLVVDVGEDRTHQTEETAHRTTIQTNRRW